MKQNCVKCKNSIQIISCHGCQQIFCTEHVREHREELSQRIDHIIEEYHQFEDEFNKDDLIQPYISRINQWEHESIRKIQRTAERARNDLNKILDRMKVHLKSSVDKITQNIQSNRQSKDFTELNLKDWMKQLRHLQHIQKTSLTEDIIDDSRSSIPLIKIIDTKQAFTSDGFEPLPQEKFDGVVGKIDFSSDHRFAKCTGNNWNGSTICGKNLYVSGIHTIRFHINKMGIQNPFFGIKSTLHEPNPWNRTTPFAYGWWKIPWTYEEIKNKKNEKPNEDTTIKTGDDMTLTINCTNNEIELENHRTNQYTFERIPYEKCPFPWKFAIVLYSPGDSISIVS